MDWDLLERIGVYGACFGLTLWAIRGYITERTKPAVRIDPLLVPVNMGMCIASCKERREEMEKMTAINLKQAVELIAKDLEHGQKKFDKFGKTLDHIAGEFSKMGTTITKLDTKLNLEIEHATKERDALEAKIDKK